MKPHFIVEVGARGPARHAHKSKDLSTRDFLAWLHVESREMGKTSRNTETVIDDNQVSVPGTTLCTKDRSMGRCQNLAAKGRRDVDARVIRQLARVGKTLPGPKSTRE